MNKTTKKVLFITDDYDSKNEMIRQISSGDYFFHEEYNYLSFDLKIIEKITNYDGGIYDAVLIDYGLVNDRLDILNLIYRTGAKMAWVGGLGCNYYNDDIKKRHTNIEHLILPTSEGISVDNVLEILYILFDKEASR